MLRESQLVRRTPVGCMPYARAHPRLVFFLGPRRHRLHPPALPQKVRGLAKVPRAECHQFWSQGCDGGEGEQFSISALRSGNDGSEWSEGEQHPSGRPLSVSAQGMHAQGIPTCTPYARGLYAVCPCPPEARFFSRPPSPPTPPSCSPSKSSWAGQSSPRRVPPILESGMRWRRRGAVFDFGPAVRERRKRMERRGTAPIRSAPLGECSGNACSGNPNLYAVRPWVVCRMPVPTRGSFFFSAPVATDSTLLLSLKKFVGWPKFPAQSATNSGVRDAMEAKGSSFRFRPCGQGTTEANGAKGNSTHQVGPSR